MKQIVDKLNKIAKKIDESVEIPQTDLIIDSLDAITKAYGGTPNDSNLIVDKLEDIASVAHSGITPTGNIAITENTAEGVPLDIAQYATATVNVSGGGDNYLILPMTGVTWDGQAPGGALSTEPDLSFITDGAQVIMKLNVVAEDPEDNFSVVSLATYSHSVGPITEGFRGEAENNVLISLTHTYEGNFPWYLSVTVSAEPMAGTYQIGIVTDIPDPVS